MADSFNPYRDWLGLADGQRPTTYYGLFGLKPLESDAERIRGAVVRLMAKVRAILPGSRMREWQQIMDEISAAKFCLIDPAAKAAYDAQLRGAVAKQKQPQPDTAAPRRPDSRGANQPTGPQGQRQSPRSTGQPAAGTHLPPPAAIPESDSLPNPIAPPIVRPPRSPSDGRNGGRAAEADNWDQADGEQEYPDFTVPPDYAPPVAVQAGGPIRGSKPSALRRTRRRTSHKVGLALGLLLIVAVIAGPLGMVLYQEYHKSVDSAQAPAKKAEKHAAPKAEADQLKPAADSQAPREDPAALQKSLAEVVAALAKRDISAARFVMSNAASNARTPEDQKTVEKYKKLCDNVEQFWRVIWERASKFRPKEEVTLGKTRIVIVEAAEGQFSFKVGSKIRVCTAETIPSWLAIVLAEANLGGDGLSKEIYGAFLAVDPEGDRSRAKALWSEAASAGSKIEDLLPSIDSLPPTARP